VSEADGSFTLSNVPADSYGIAIKASKNGYKDSYTMPMGVGEEDEDEIPIILLSSYVYNFLVQGGDAPGHTEGKGDIIGEVDDLNGDPVSGVSIQAKYIENGDDAGTVMYFNDEMQPDDSREATGNSGIFCIYNVDPGKPIQITATSAGKTFSSRIAIAYSDSITFVGVFQTEGNLDVNGSVEDEEENAVEGVTVSIPGTNFFTQTNETGNFTLVLPDFSPVFFRLAKNEYKNMYFEGFIDSEEMDEEIDLFILSENAYNQFLNQIGITHTSGKGDIAGSVGEDDGIAGAIVKVYAKDGNEVNCEVYYMDEDSNFDTSLTQTTSDGGFVIPNLDPGFYYITAIKNGFEFQIVGTYVFGDGITIIDELINWPPIQFLYKHPPQEGDTQVETQNVASDAKSVSVFKFDLFVNYPDVYEDYFTEPKNVVIESIKFTVEGTGDPSSSLSSAKLYYSSDGITYTLAGEATSITHNEILFNNLNVQIGPEINNHWKLKFDFNGNANTGDTFRVEILKNSDIVSHDSDTETGNRDVTCQGDPIIGNFITIVSPPEKPENISPENGATTVNPINYELQASDFSPGNGNTTHQATRWQIRKDGETYETPTFDSGTDTTNLTSYNTPVPLEGNTKYWWHVRYQNGDGVWSDWSDETSFTTTAGGINPPGKPVNYSPEDGATEIDPQDCTLIAFAPEPGDSDTFQTSQWQITTTSGDYSNPVYDGTRTSPQDLHIIHIPAGTLSYNTTYYWHVRYQDGNGAWSDWSDETSFTTKGEKGDINGDGGVDISDVILCLRMAIGLDTPDPAVADMNDDGTVDISDVILVLRKAVGLD
ncbi:hypothetical protein J7K25_06980, partial [bacterium]|nr:hypothetical protein [bacterium]